ncbi:uncharacterized protein BJ171DRAFT_514814 [Polychytrium aggregatum]|uniref:uncharacterized protein n=1 Tax=Polychytrium aggregatum TaxID=110093 RepID=UPI0022FE0A01|nr:uncharacterized protein BJ171DRAFT_514814 [Polychytrium aggregatum]KAI9202377.1 hypothetical protein BJ171DRAFT_514814 [Polychytrium aggregatum]
MALSDPEPVATPTALACEPQRQLPPLAALSSQPESLDAAESLLALPRADETPTDLHGADGLAELLAVASKSSPCDAPAQAERISLPGDIASPCDSYSDGSSSSLPAGSADARALTCPMALLRAPGTNAAAAAADPLVSTTCYYQYIGISRWNLPRRYRSSDEESVPASIYYAQLGDRRNLSDDLASLANGNSIRLRSSASLSPRKTPYSRPVGISVGSNGSVGSSSGGASAGAGGSPSRSTTARSASPSSTGSSRSPSSSQAGSIAATKSVRSSRSKIRGQR